MTTTELEIDLSDYPMIDRLPEHLHELAVHDWQLFPKKHRTLRTFLEIEHDNLADILEDADEDIDEKVSASQLFLDVVKATCLQKL